MEQPDIDIGYVIELIADAYICVIESLEDNNLEQAEFWHNELAALVQGLERYYRKVL